MNKISALSGLASLCPAERAGTWLGSVTLGHMQDRWVMMGEGNCSCFPSRRFSAVTALADVQQTLRRILRALSTSLSYLPGQFMSRS